MTRERLASLTASIGAGLVFVTAGFHLSAYGSVTAQAPADLRPLMAALWVAGGVSLILAALLAFAAWGTVAFVRQRSRVVRAGASGALLRPELGRDSLGGSGRVISPPHTDSRPSRRMLDAIKSFVNRRIALAEPGVPLVEPPSGPAPIHLAACALLLELAYADEEFSPAERTHLEAALGRHFGLDATTARELIGLAQAERQTSVDHYQFARSIAQQYDLGQRMVLAEVMWGMVLADGRISQHEGYLLRKLANLLDLAPGYLAQARRAATPPAEE